jgi:hypothetical protein
VDFWLAPGHVEFIDHAAGSEIQIAGKRLVPARTAGGPHLRMEQFYADP